MSGSLKLGLLIIGAVVAIGIAIHVLQYVLGLILGIIVPLAVLAGIGYVLYSLFGRRALGGNRRYLP